MRVSIPAHEPDGQNHKGEFNAANVPLLLAGLSSIHYYSDERSHAFFDPAGLSRGVLANAARGAKTLSLCNVGICNHAGSYALADLVGRSARDVATNYAQFQEEFLFESKEEDWTRSLWALLATRVLGSCAVG